MVRTYLHIGVLCKVVTQKLKKSKFPPTRVLATRILVYLHLKFGRRQRHFPGGQLEVKIYVRISEVPHLATLRYNFDSKQNSLRS